MLVKSIALAAMVLGALPSVALADFSGARCENPKFIAFMSARIGRGKAINGGRQNPNWVRYGLITQATTISNDGKTIACEVVVGINGRNGGRSQRGRFTATARSWQWLPNS
jgi:hypothetical protein